MNLLATRGKWWLGGAGAAAAIFGAYLFVYASPRDELLGKIKAAREEEQRLVGLLRQRAVVSKKLSEFGATTLGSKLDVVDKRFRDGLNQIAAQCGLGGVVVQTGQPLAQPSPLRSAKGVQSTLKRAIGQLKEPDFRVIGGTLKGTGTLDQVLRALAAVQAQAWVHRVDDFSVKPRGKEREQFDLAVSVSTMIAPNLVTADKEPTVVPAPAAMEAMWSAVAGKNMFREPPPPAPPPVPPTVVAQTPTPAPTPAPPPAPPYNDWKLVGLVRTERGVEAWVLNTKTNERAVLSPGGKVLDLTFVEGAGERAVFDLGGQKFAFVNGQVLGVRTPAEQSPGQ
ncbi:MAG: hypothetical protein JNL50_07725 [Phycisphaerae bacterium]|nr:hypothetical protein [Phycisphaerae bacterium]